MISTHKCTDGKIKLYAKNICARCMCEGHELVESKPTTTNDPVNQPSHYTYGDIETIDYIEQVANLYKPKQAVSVANVIKYVSRAPLKNGKQDIDKAIWYLERLRGLM